MKGMITPLMTPLHQDGTVDTHSLERLVEYQIAGNVDGIFLFGTAGEGNLLTTAQRRQVLEHTVASVKGRVPSLAGISDVSVPRAAERIRMLEAYDIAAYVSTLPYISTLTAAEQLHYYQSLTGLTNRPLVLYNIPAFTRSEIQVSVLSELLACPQIIGLKESSGNVIRWRELAALKAQRPDFRLMTGHPALVDIALELGFDGAVLSVANIMPGLCKALHTAFLAQDFAKTRMLQQTMLEIHNRIAAMIGGSYASIAPIKLVLRQLGLFETAEMVPPYRATGEDMLSAADSVAKRIRDCPAC